MSVFLMIRVECPNLSIGDLNTMITNDSNPENGINQLRNLMDSVNIGCTSAIIDVASRETTETVSAQGNGIDATYNKA